MSRSRHLLGAALVTFSLAHACKKEEPPPAYPGAGAPAPYPAPTYPTGPGPTPAPTAPAPAPTPGPTAPTPAPTAATPSGPPAAMGLPCTSDADFICPFAHCLNGRCGGCQSQAECKPGATCASTPLGMSCVPGGSPAPAPTPSATTPPAPPPSATTPPAQPPPPPADAFAEARQRCLKRTNEYRATKQLPALSLKGDTTCSDGQAQSDAMSKTPHGAFGKCAEAAQNECPGWKGAPASVTDACIKAMFDEGPGTGPQHGHHNNIMDAGYKELACGFFVASDGSVWLVQDFYR